MWKPTRRWKKFVVEETAMFLARLYRDGTHVKAAEILMLTLWLEGTHEELKSLLEEYAGRSMEVYEEYELPPR